MTALLEIDRLSVAYGASPALSDLSMTVAAQEIVGVVGESGSGKSTLGLAIMGLLSEAAEVTGAIRFEGIDLSGLTANARRDLLGRRIAYVPQEPLSALNPTLRIGRQIDLVLRRHIGGDRRARRAVAVESLAAMAVADPDRVLASYPFQLSGGQLQRALIATALSLRPALLIADEPTTALDVTVQAEVLTLLRRATGERGAAVLFISHNLGVVSQLSTRSIVMRRGAIVEAGPTREVLGAPKHAYTRQLLAAMPGRNPARTPLPVAAA